MNTFAQEITDERDATDAAIDKLANTLASLAHRRARDLRTIHALEEENAALNQILVDVRARMRLTALIHRMLAIFAVLAIVGAYFVGAH